MAERATAVMNAMAEVARVVAAVAAAAVAAAAAVPVAPMVEMAVAAAAVERAVSGMQAEKVPAATAARFSKVKHPRTKDQWAPSKPPSKTKRNRDSNSHPSALMRRLNHSATYSTLYSVSFFIVH